MGITEEILHDWKRQGAEEKERELEQKFSRAILNLQQKGFTNKEITEILGLSIDEILRLTDK